jgi:hypothetical protein
MACEAQVACRPPRDFRGDECPIPGGNRTAAMAFVATWRRRLRNDGRRSLRAKSEAQAQCDIAERGLRTARRRLLTAKLWTSTFLALSLFAASSPAEEAEPLLPASISATPASFGAMSTDEIKARMADLPDRKELTTDDRTTIEDLLSRALAAVERIETLRTEADRYLRAGGAQYRTGPGAERCYCARSAR